MVRVFRSTYSRRVALIVAVCVFALALCALPATVAKADEGSLVAGSPVDAGAVQEVDTGKGDIAPGTYYIASAYATDQVVSLRKSSRKNGANVEVNAVRGAKIQRWGVEIDAKGYALLKNGKSGKVLAIEGEKAAKDANAVQWKAKSSKDLSQRWIIKKKGSRYQIVSALNKKFALYVKGKKAKGDLNATVRKKADTKRQLFTFVPAAPSPAQAGTQTVPDGLYLMQSAVGKNSFVTIADASKKNGANVQISAGSNTTDQVFNVQYDGQGFYTLKNVNSGKALVPAANCSVPGVNAVQSAKVNGTIEKWRIDKTADGYMLVSKATGLALDVAGGKDAEGTNVRMWKAKGKKSQTFALLDRASVKLSVSGTFYICMASNANKVLDVHKNKRINGTKVVIDKRTDTNLQRIKIVDTGKGSYYLRNVATKRLVTAEAVGKNGKSAITMRDKVKKADQEWKIEYNDDFTIGFRSAKTGLALEVSGGKAKNGTKLYAVPANAASNGQKFQLKRTSKTKETVTIGVPCIMQNPQLPTGCESVALTNALNYWGFHLYKTTIANSWMPYGSDGVYNFIGSPRNSSGWIICAPGIAKTANDYLSSKGSDISAQVVHGESLKSLRKYLDRGYPVVVWTTIGMGSPGPVSHYRHGYPLRSNNHAVVLTGYNPKSGKYQVSDSLAGRVWRSGSRFTTLYNQMGKQAVVLSD